MKPRIHVLEDPATLAQAVARRWCELAAAAQAARGVFTVALAGGSTPRLLYETLATPPWRDDMDWRRCEIFFGDERSVPPDHPDSNYRMARESLLAHVPVPPDRVHRMAGELRPLEEAAQRYADCMAARLPRTEDGFPCLDLVLLGLGPDGHIASLFPDTAVLEEARRWVAPVHVDKLSTWRLTLTYPVIDHARQVILLVAGEGKRAIVREVLGGKPGSDYPVLRLQPRGELHWYLDAAAAADLPPPGS